MQAAEGFEEARCEVRPVLICRVIAKGFHFAPERACAINTFEARCPVKLFWGCIR